MVINCSMTFMSFWRNKKHTVAEKTYPPFIPLSIYILLVNSSGLGSDQTFQTPPADVETAEL